MLDPRGTIHTTPVSRKPGHARPWSHAGVDSGSTGTTKRRI